MHIFFQLCAKMGENVQKMCVLGEMRENVQNLIGKARKLRKWKNTQNHEKNGTGFEEIIWKYEGKCHFKKTFNKSKIPKKNAK